MSDDERNTPTEDALDEVGGRALVEAWRASGLSGAAFCRRRKLRAQRLHYSCNPGLGVIFNCNYSIPD